MKNRSFKKVFILCFLLLTKVLSMSAQQVTKETALSKATQFFLQSNMVSKRAARKTPQFTLANNRNEFYVFNDEANGGYVVVSGEERMPDVLGFSFTGHFDAENIPCNMKAWLEDYAAQVAYLRTHPEIPASRRTAPERDEISPLLNCHFNQGKYYNEKCPIVDGEHCWTGCVATAMAQIMYYYQWPKQTTDVIPAYTTGTNNINMPAIPVTSINWDNMLNEYNSEKKYSNKQIEAISTLMLLCGTSVRMNYGLDESGANLYAAAAAFLRYFDYDDLLEYLSRNNWELEEWEQTIYDELNSSRPVVYRGKPDIGNGHAFVMDGYKDGYFHVNWGWGGNRDDYFLLTNLMGYNYQQQAIVGIQAAYPDIPRRYAVLDNGKMTLYYDNEKSHRTGIILPHMDQWSNYKDQITECVIDPSFANLQPRSLYMFFSQWRQLKSIVGLENLNTSKATSMGYMFSGCSGLESLDVSGFKTDNVMDMNNMFYGCSGLKNLDVSSFNTDNVMDMHEMFAGCSGLKNLNVSGLNNGKVTNMCNMFFGCSSLKKLDISGFKTDKVTNMEYMFNGCSGLKNLDVSSFNTDCVTDMGYMFNDCSGLKNLDVSSFNTDCVTDMGYMFNGCSSLTNLDVSKFKTDKVRSMGRMFYGCSSLTNLDVSGFKTDNVTYMSSMFYRCSGLTSLDISRFKTDKVTDMSWMFYGCSSLTNLDVSGFKTDNVTDMNNMFANCSSLTSLDVSGFKTDNVTNMEYMFHSCSGLTNLDISRFKTDKVTSMRYMFCSCSGLTNLDVRGFKTDNVTDMNNMFANCSSLTSLDVSGFKTGNVTDMGFMFYGCSSLTSLDVSKFKTGNVKSMRCMFHSCFGLTSLDVSSFKTDKVTDMGWMFYGCAGLKSLDISGFKTGNVTSMGRMFYGCDELRTIYASEKWDMTNVAFYNDMFWGCYKLIGGEGTTYNPNHIGAEYAHIDGGPDNPGYFTYQEPPAGIRNIHEEIQNVKWYTFDGKQITNSRKGLNITRMSNGQIRKIVMKQTL